MGHLKIKSWEEYKTEAESSDVRDYTQFGQYFEISNTAFMLSATSQEANMSEIANRLGTELGKAVADNGLRPVQQLEVIIKDPRCADAYSDPLNQRTTFGAKITAKATGQREDWARYVYVQALRAIETFNVRAEDVKEKCKELNQHHWAASELLRAGVLTEDQARKVGYISYKDLPQDDEEDYCEEEETEEETTDTSSWYNSDYD